MNPSRKLMSQLFFLLADTQAVPPDPAWIRTRKLFEQLKGKRALIVEQTDVLAQMRQLVGWTDPAALAARILLRHFGLHGPAYGSDASFQ
jgi:hypothetical protein